MKLEPTPINGASLLDTDANREGRAAATTRAMLPEPAAMSYAELLPYLLLPMAGAY